MRRVWFAAGSCTLAALIVGTGLIARAEPKPAQAAKPAAQTAAPAAQAKTAAADQAKPAADGIVGVYIESVSRQVRLSDLQKNYPGTSAARVDPAALRADAIVGWYDKGNNFHEQKMEKNLGHDFGGLKVIQPMLRGVAVK